LKLDLALIVINRFLGAARNDVEFGIRQFAVFRVKHPDRVPWSSVGMRFLHGDLLAADCLAWSRVGIARFKAIETARIVRALNYRCLRFGSAARLLRLYVSASWRRSRDRAR
jgi:hypothetical protein